MKVPHTWFSTGLRTDRLLLRTRLQGLFAGPRRRGGLVLLFSVALTVCLGTLVSCREGTPEGAPESQRLSVDQDALALAAVEAAGLWYPDFPGTWTYLLTLQDGIAVEGAPVDFPAGPDLGCVLSYDSTVHAGGFGNLLFFTADGETGELEGTPVLLSADENDLRWWAEEDGVHLLYTTVTTYQGFETCQAGETLWADNTWTWLWPAAPGSQDYTDFWLDWKGVLTSEGLDLYTRGNWFPDAAYGQEPQWVYDRSLPFQAEHS